MPLLAGLAAGDGTRLTTAEVRPLDGADEEWLAAQSPELATAFVTTGLLARTVVALGSSSPPDPEALLALAVADRDLLLLAVRRATYGDRFDVVLSCTACGEPMDVSFSADAIPVRWSPAPPVPLARSLPDGAGGTVEVRLRPPTGSDQEAAAAGEEAPLDVLLRRCLVAVADGPGGDEGWDALPDAARGAFAAAVEEASAAIELALDLTCPECGVEFGADLDLARYLLGEFAVPAGSVLQDLHLLASAYHWSEPDVLRIPSPRRRALAALVAQDLRRAQVP